MGGFRIGRKHAQHTYPDTPRAAVAAFARNSAVGPAGGPQGIILSGTPVPWSGIASGAATPTPDVPITPKVTGVVRIIFTVVVENVSNTDEDVGVAVQVNGVTKNTFSEEVPGTKSGVTGIVTISGVVDLEPPIAGTPLPVGVTSNIEIVLTAGTDSESLQLDNATLDIQELPAATG